jgi:hypothetical protein
MSELETIILRMPGDEGDFTYRMAKLPPNEAEQWEQKLSAQGAQVDELQVPRFFGPPVNLAEAMELLDTRDFRVLDIPAYQYQ